MMLHSLNHVAGVHDVDKLNLFLGFPDGVSHRMRIETGFGAYFQDVREGVLGLLECCASNL